MPTVSWKEQSWLVAALALGLFAGRVLSEVIRPGMVGAVLLTVAAVGVGVWGMGKRPLRVTWPAVLLLGYVFYPEPDPAVAAQVAGLALLVFGVGEDVNAKAQRREGRKGWVVVWNLVLVVGFLVLYVRTLAPGVLTADNGEFQLVAAELGVAHPPGFPLYTMLGHLMTRLPLGPTPAYRLNLLSAVTSVATLSLVHLTVYRLTRSNVAGVAAGLALGTATTFWAQATTANIRSLTAFFAVLVVYLLLEIRENPKSQIPNPKEEEENSKSQIPNPKLNRLLFLLGLAMSLGLTHHASLLFMGVVFGLFLMWVEPAVLRRPRYWVWLGLGGVLGLLPLLYLPWRASVGARGAAADLTTLAGFLNHVLALGFRGDFFAFTEAAELWQRLVIMGNVMTFQFHPLLLAGMGLGLLLLLHDDRKVALLLGGAFAVHTLVTAMYRAPQTVEYMMPAYGVAVVCLGYGVGTVLNPKSQIPNPNNQNQNPKSQIPNLNIQESNPKSQIPNPKSLISNLQSPIGALLAGVMVVSAVWQGVERWPSYVALSGDGTARVYAEGILAEAPAGSVVLADWHWVTPLWYLQEVEGQRPDVAVRYVFPTGETYAATWARRIGEELAGGRPVVATHFDAATYATLPAPEPLGEAFLFRQEGWQALPAGFTEVGLLLGEMIQVVGYRLEGERVEIGREAILTLAWRPVATLEAPTSLFAHVVGADNLIYAQQDVAAVAQGEGITLTQLRLTPRPGALPGSFDILVGAYSTGPLLDEAGEARTRIGGVMVATMGQRPYSQNRVYRPAADGSRRLVGYDWDRTLPGRTRLYLHWQTAEGYVTEVRDDGNGVLAEMVGPWGITGNYQIPNPKSQNQNYVPLGQGVVWLGDSISNRQLPIPGQSLVLGQRFGSGRPVLRDLVVSVRLVGFEADGFHWAWWDLNDGVPAWGAIPTLKWIGGSRVYDPHVVMVDGAAVEGQTVGGLLVMYDAFTGRPVAILDEGISQETTWIPLGTGIIEIGD
jgi:hypothetical protein